MQDEAIRELFHRMDVRLEWLDTTVDHLEQSFADLRRDMHSRFSSIDTRLDAKAGTWAVGLWGATLAMLVGAAFALTKWL
jgi:hypothetical protein